MKTDDQLPPPKPPEPSIRGLPVPRDVAAKITRMMAADRAKRGRPL